MLTFPQFDPVAFTVFEKITVLGKTFGPLQVHWYGLMYLFGFAACWSLGMYRSRKDYYVVHARQMDDLLFYVAMGVVLGARVGYVFFYQFQELMADPAMILRLWEGGMSFHGGLLGVIVATMLYCRKVNQNFFDVIDFFAPFVPIALGLGRLGNFIGGELYGRATDLPWAMVFPKDPLQLARHPSQLYQMFFEGLVLFVILFWFSSKLRPRAAVSALFVFLYGCVRFGVEFVRQPDAQITYLLFGWMTRGQMLCVPMLLIGGGVFIWAMKRQKYSPGKPAEARQVPTGSKAKKG
jgi:phosphatidylglycerol:prolipoprotein diacylglycerol transferase